MNGIRVRKGWLTSAAVFLVLAMAAAVGMITMKNKETAIAVGNCA